MAFEIGQTIGDYQIIGVLGTGGMGKVYKVRNVISDRLEAMKVLLPDLANEAELADRFMREIKLLASLNHPNIAKLHTATRINNQLLMMMELTEGQTLEEVLQNGPLPVAQAVNYIIQALDALAYAHDHGVVHRDIKPANMMVTANGQLKLMDFGIAKAVADRRLTMTGTTLGSLFYMSPEQVKGSAEIDGRSDLYSVGVSLYELVTGTRPFKGESDYSIMVAHLEQQPVPPIQIHPAMPPELSEIIMAAIEKDPANRFQAAQAFRAALASVAQTLPEGLIVPPPPRAEEFRPAASVPTQTMAPPSYQPPTPPPAAPIEPQMASAPEPVRLPTEPMMVPPAAPPPYVAPPPAAQPGGHRGLWMAMGAIVAVAVLAVLAFQLPRWYRAKAGGGAPVEQPLTPQPSATDTNTPSTPAEPAAQNPTAGQETPANQPAATAVQSPSVPSQVPPTSRGAGRAARSAGGSATPLPMQSEPAPSAPYAPPAQAQQSQPSAPAVDNSALEEVRDRMSTIGPRANALRSSLHNLEQQQKAQGVGMRMDISTSWKRMENFLDEAEAAMKSGNADRAKTKLDQAEREADRLDKFLGH